MTTKTKNVLITTDLHQKIKVIAAEKGMTLKSFVEMAIWHFLEQAAQKPGGGITLPHEPGKDIHAN